MHHASENLESHLANAVIGAVHGEVILNIDVTIRIKIELHVADLVVEHIAGFHNTGSLLRGSVGDQTEDACRNVLVIIAADEPHDHVGPAVDGKTCQQLFAAMVTDNVELDAALLKGLCNKVGCVEFVLVHFRTSFRF